MRWKAVSIILALSILSPLAAQNLFIYKDAAFAQVAAGEGWETRITLHNRGTFRYEGTLFFSTGEGGIPWNPFVDGTQISEGKFEVSLKPGETVTLRITGNEKLTPGNAILTSRDLVLDNFIESNLTYFVKSGTRTTDSIGVLPSAEFYVATVPFENFANVAIALGNADLVDPMEDIDIELLLSDAQGVFQVSKTITLSPFGHKAEFLLELFEGAPVSQGKLEIRSDLPVIGTALTVVDNQVSSLPLKPSPIAYTIRMVSTDDRVLNGQIVLWAEGYRMGGYLVISHENDDENEPFTDPGFNIVTGQLIDAFLDLNFIGQGPPYGEPPDNDFWLIHLEAPAFSFSNSSQNGQWFVSSLQDGSVIDSGEFTIQQTTAIP